MITKRILFGVPVVKSWINPDLYDKSNIVKAIHHNYKIDPNRNEWPGGEYSNIHHSYNDWKNPKFKKIDFSKLINVYKKVIVDSINTYRFKGRVDITAFIRNYTCMKTTQSMQQHNHVSPYRQIDNEHHTDFTSIHYIKFNEKKHIPTMYVNSQAWSKYYDHMCPKHKSFLDDTYTENSFIFDEYQLDVLEDDIVFVPSILEHHIPIQTSDETRITIVSNISITKPK